MKIVAAVDKRFVNGPEGFSKAQLKQMNQMMSDQAIEAKKKSNSKAAGEYYSTKLSRKVYGKNGINDKSISTLFKNR